MKKNEHRVTAVIPARNCRRALARCIAALKAGDCPTDLIVVDDASEDGTAEMVKAKWPSAVVLRLPVHTGFAHAANIGLRLVRTDYAFLIRPELQPGRSCVRKLLEALGGNLNKSGSSRSDGGTMPLESENIFCAVPDPSPGKASHRTDRIANAGQPADGRKSLRRNRRILAVPDGCALYRMTGLEEIGWFDERHYDGLEALDLSLRAAAVGLRTVQAGGAYVRPAGVCEHEQQTGKEEQPAGSDNAYGLPMDTLRRQLAAGNGVYVLYKHLFPLSRVIGAPILAAAEAVRKRTFAGHGEEEEYGLACVRGRALCSLDRERREALQDGISVWAESLPDAAFLGMDEDADRIYPLYLAQKEPLSLSDLPGSAGFQADLLRSLPEILRLMR